MILVLFYWFQSEVASLTKAKAAVPTVFTPYVIPDAHCLCSGLHLIKKMLKSEKFLFIVPMAGMSISLSLSLSLSLSHQCVCVCHCSD